jgi:murein DD-endopeptidase MepM/ murein hydrolase activator NlpD
MDSEPAHQGISVGGRGEIVAPTEGVVVFSRGTRVRIHHGLDSNKQHIYTDHFHVHGRLIEEGDKVKRGQAIGLIGAGKNTSFPHYHYVVTKEERPRRVIPLNPNDYWFGIDHYNEKLEKGLNVGPFAISCFDPNATYPKEPIRFTYPARCK